MNKMKPIINGDKIVFNNYGTINICCCCKCSCVPDGSGSGGSGSGGDSLKPFKLLRSPSEVIGNGYHRSGWPFVFKYLQQISSDDGSILLDDFVEQNFCYSDSPKVYNSPWVGIFHHPPSPPEFANQRENLSNVFKNSSFQKSLPHLKFAIALSEYLGDFLRKELDIDVLVLKHPIGIPDLKWDFDRFVKNKDKKLLQLGFYLRNTRILSQMPRVSRFKKVRMWTNKKWVQEYDLKVAEYYNTPTSEIHTVGVEDLGFVPASTFDQLLSNNVVVMDVFDASANNGVLDCIVRNTPIIVNRHPAVEEYLGKDYPLYFDKILFGDYRELSIPDERFLEAHEYLKNMDKTWTNGHNFASNIMEYYEKIRN